MGDRGETDGLIPRTKQQYPLLIVISLGDSRKDCCKNERGITMMRYLLKKSLLAFIASLVAISLFLQPVSATVVPEDCNESTIERIVQIENVLAEMATVKCQLSKQTISSSEYQQLILTLNGLEEQLIPLAVSKVTYEELVSQGLLENDPLRIGYPNSTAKIEWYSTTVNYTLNSHTYTVQRIYAQGKTPTSVLHKSGAVSYSPNKINNASTSAIVMKITTALVDLGVSYVTSPLVSWTWSQLNSLLGGALTTRDIDSCSLNYNLISTICFSYVSYTANSQQYFCLGSSMVQGYALIVVASQLGPNGGGQYNYTINKRSSYFQTNSGLAKAINNYNNSSGITCSYSYIDDIKFIEYNSYCLKTVVLSTPSTMNALFNI